MRKEDITKENYDRILECFMRTLMKNGLKATTMDSIASSLQMSKRTLYEIFGTKDCLFKEVHLYFHNKMSEKLEEIFASSNNVMEAIIKCFLFNRDFMSNLSMEFIKDMQEFAKNSQNNESSKKHQHPQNLYNVLKRGVDEGYFRDDVNLLVQCRMLNLQMESLKNSEQLFPEDISLLEVYDSIIIGFLRGISSSKGLQELEKYMPSLTKLSHKSAKDND